MQVSRTSVMGLMIITITIVITWQRYNYCCSSAAQWYPGVKVSPNALERCSGAWKFKLGAFRLQNYWILQLEPTFLGPAT